MPSWPYARLRTYPASTGMAGDLNAIEDATVDQMLVPLRLVDDFTDNPGLTPLTSRYTNNSGGGNSATIVADSAAGAFGAVKFHSPVGSGGEVYVITKAACGISTGDFRMLWRVRAPIIDATTDLFFGIGNGLTPGATFRGFRIFTPDVTKWKPFVTGLTFQPLAFVAPSSAYQVVEMNRVSGQLNFLVNGLHICTVADGSDFSSLKFTFTNLFADLYVDWYGFGP